MTNNRGRPRQLRKGHFELRLGRRNKKRWEDLTSLVQGVSMGFLHVQWTIGVDSMILLEVLGLSPRKILKIRYNEIEFGSNFDWNPCNFSISSYMLAL